uniref:Uncharacterized protein n=1 Tax=Triticum urartu TaxID=4572 RepID=A0A8R7TAW4_TRIUA
MVARIGWRGPGSVTRTEEDLDTRKNQLTGVVVASLQNLSHHTFCKPVFHHCLQSRTTCQKTEMPKFKLYSNRNIIHTLHLDA